MDRLAVELLFLFLSLPFSLLNYSYGSDIKERETKENHSVITPGEPFGFLFHFFCWLSEHNNFLTYSRHLPKNNSQEILESAVRSHNFLITVS